MTKLIHYYKRLSLPVKASLWFMICSILQRCINIITTPIFTRMLTTTEYGYISIYNTWENLIAIFATLRLSEGSFNRAMVDFKEDRDSYTSSCLLISTCVTVFLYIIYLAFNQYIDSVTSLNLFLMTMIFLDIILVSAVSLWTVRNRYEFRYINIIAITLLSSFLAPIIGIILIYIIPDHRAEAKVTGTLIAHIIVYSIVYYLIIKRGGAKIKREHAKFALKFNIPLLPHYLSQLVLGQSDRLMIESMCSASEAGIYSIAYNLGQMLTIITQAIGSSFVPWLYSRLEKQDYRAIRKVTVLLEIFVGICCLVFSLFAPEAVAILAPQEYLSAIWVVPPCTMSIVFIMLNNWFVNVQFYHKKNQSIMYASVIAAATNIILNYVFIPLFGFAAAGYTTLACYCFLAISQFLFMKNVCKEAGMPQIYNAKVIWGISFALSGISIIIAAFYKYTWQRYLIIVTILIFTLIMFAKVKGEIIDVFKKKGKLENEF